MVLTACLRVSVKITQIQSITVVIVSFSRCMEHFSSMSTIGLIMFGLFHGALEAFQCDFHLICV